MVDLPLPVSPTSAMVSPAFTERLKSFSTFSPSVYWKETFLNSMSPLRPGQFSRLGLKLSPYTATTSGVSAISGSVSSSADHALGRGLGLLGFGEDAGDVCDRVEDLHGVADERRQRADGDGAQNEHVVPALPQQERRCKAAQPDDHGIQRRGEHRRADGGLAHVGGQSLEFLDSSRPRARGSWWSSRP